MRLPQVQMWAAAALPTPAAHERYGRWGLHRGRKLLGIAGPNSSQSPGGNGPQPASGVGAGAVWVGEVTRVTFECILQHFLRAVSCGAIRIGRK